MYELKKMKQKRAYGHLKCIASRNHSKHCHVENARTISIHDFIVAIYKLDLLNQRFFLWPMVGRCLQCGREYHGYS